MFRKQDLMQQYLMGYVPAALLSAIFAVSAALSSNEAITTLDASKIGEYYASLVRQSCSLFWMSDAPATISDLQAIFLLAVYEFRTSRPTAWVTIGHLVRLAYHYGLHQIDNADNCSFYEEGVTSEVDLESWRYLWWSIYLLDTCCNSVAATPSNIDLDSLCTALPTGSVEGWISGRETASSTRQFLQPGIDELLQILNTACTKWPQLNDDEFGLDTSFSVRIVITSQIRNICNLHRAMNQNRAVHIERRWQLLSNHLTSTHMALPSRYHDPRRAISLGEQKQPHALRLINLLEISLCHLLVTIPKSTSQHVSKEDWLSYWDTSMLFVDKVVQIVRNWDPSLYHLADPCVSYIIFIAIMMAHMNTTIDTGRKVAAEVEEINRSSWWILLLFLQQLSNHWVLPKALISKCHFCVRVLTLFIRS